MNKEKLLAVTISLCLMVFASNPVSGENTAKPDVWLESQITTTYTLNEHLNSFELTADVKDGVAILSGEVDNSVERSLAVEIARGVDGVTGIKNNIVIASEAKKSEKSSGFRTKVDNASLAARVKLNLLWNKDTSGLDIDVDANSGVVTLKGSVSSEVERSLAVQVAKNTSGVRRVNDMLAPEKKENRSAFEKKAEKARAAVSDMWITAKVKSRLLYDQNTRGLDIKVSTEKGVVTLKGDVSDKIEKDYAVKLVENVVHVDKVIDKLTVKK